MTSLLLALCAMRVRSLTPGRRRLGGLALGVGGDVLRAVERGLRAGVVRALPLPDGTRRAVVPHVGRVGGAALRGAAL